MSESTPGGEHHHEDDGIEIAHGWADDRIRILLGVRPRFTRRQREILALVAKGLSNAEIASTLGISRRTVDKHLEAIHMRAGTTSRARLVAALHRGRDD